MSEILNGDVFLQNKTGRLEGKEIGEKETTFKDLNGYFADEGSYRQMDLAQVIYRVQFYLPVDEGTEGGLFFGNTTIYPGKVGKEYFMTKGHFHLQLNRAEFYWCISGKGMLILMDQQRHCRAIKMEPGSLHYIPGFTGHRVANTGDDVLVFGACWPSDAGHNYTEIAKRGFSARLMEVNGKPVLIDEA